MKKALKRHGAPAAIVTDGQKSYKAAMADLGNEQKQEIGRHADIHNHFNLERHLVDRETFKQRRSAALAEWRQIAS